MVEAVCACDVFVCVCVYVCVQEAVAAADNDDADEQFKRFFEARKQTTKVRGLTLLVYEA